MFLGGVELLLVITTLVYQPGVLCRAYMLRSARKYDELMPAGPVLVTAVHRTCAVLKQDDSVTQEA